MYANRFTAVIDANVLASALERNLVLSLAAAGLFRVRWSETILGETERAIAEILHKQPDAFDAAFRACRAMREAFDEAMVHDWETYAAGVSLPDQDDVHVVAAARAAQAAVIVTNNTRHFPVATLVPFGLEAKSADDFIADALDLDHATGAAAIARMRQRFNRPSITADALLLKLEARGLTQTASALAPYAELI